MRILRDEIRRLAVHIGEIASPAAGDQDLPVPAARYVPAAERAAALPRNRRAHQPSRSRAQHNHIEFASFPSHVPLSPSAQEPISTVSSGCPGLAESVYCVTFIFSRTVVTRLVASVRPSFCRLRTSSIASILRPCFEAITEARHRFRHTGHRFGQISPVRIEMQVSRFLLPDRFVVTPIAVVHIRHGHRLVPGKNREAVRQLSVTARRGLHPDAGDLAERNRSARDTEKRFAASIPSVDAPASMLRSPSARRETAEKQKSRQP